MTSKYGKSCKICLYDTSISELDLQTYLIYEFNGKKISVEREPIECSIDLSSLQHLNAQELIDKSPPIGLDGVSTILTSEFSPSYKQIIEEEYQLPREVSDYLRKKYTPPLRQIILKKIST